MDWIEWRNSDKCRLAALQIPDSRLVLNEECLKALEKCVKKTEPSKVVVVVGDQGVGKSTIVAELLRDPVVRNMSGNMVVDAERTTGVRVFTNKVKAQTSIYKYLLIDTEGLNSAEPPEGVPREQYNSYYRPGLQQLIPQLAYQAASLVIYCSGSPMPKAYSDCVEAFHVTSGGTPVNRSRETIKPTLLVLLNKQPLRKCFSSDKDEVEYVTEEACSEALRGCDERNGGCLGNFFCSLHAFMLPLKDSKFRPRNRSDVQGGPVFGVSISTLQVVIHHLLTDQIRHSLEIQKGVGKAILSEAAWVRSLPIKVGIINEAIHKWGCPVLITADDIRKYNTI
eukprot:TRINITY_DN19259_c0_g1_i1.p1 TRINITY_DN19259_c0_g1~~TRINITY_DN19259_c0_g1_i1.p1  ORF type:complete len:338 (+),score=77.65 TRINITY_DN19259_c0_g1_i1:69-1082(+)